MKIIISITSFLILALLTTNVFYLKSIEQSIKNNSTELNNLKASLQNIKISSPKKLTPEIEKVELQNGDVFFRGQKLKKRSGGEYQPATLSLTETDNLFILSIRTTDEGRQPIKVFYLLPHQIKNIHRGY